MCVVLMCVCWTLRGGVLVKLPGPLNTSLSEKQLMDEWEISLKDGRKEELRNNTVLMKAAKPCSLQVPTIMPPYLLVSCALGQTVEEREPMKKEDRKKPHVIPLHSKVGEGRTGKEN